MKPNIKLAMISSYEGNISFPNNARMKNRRDVDFGKVVYVSIIYHIQNSWLNLLDGYDFDFWLRDSANR